MIVAQTSPVINTRLRIADLLIVDPAEANRIWLAAQAAADAAGCRDSMIGRLARKGFLIEEVLRARPGVTHAIACRLARQIERRAIRQAGGSAA